jgi:hypothetical protein
LVNTVIAEGIEFPAGTVGTVISVYEGDKGYAVKLEPATGNPVVATLLAHQMKRVP